jgi:hypothetical protein
MLSHPPIYTQLKVVSGKYNGTSDQAVSTFWLLQQGVPADYPFTVANIRVESKGKGSRGSIFVRECLNAFLLDKMILIVPNF